MPETDRFSIFTLMSLAFVLTGCAPTSSSAPTDADGETGPETEVPTPCESGFKRDECLPDFSLIGPDGEFLTLSAYWGDVVFISSGAMW